MQSSKAWVKELNHDLGSILSIFLIQLERNDIIPSRLTDEQKHTISSIIDETVESLVAEFESYDRNSVS